VINVRTLGTGSSRPSGPWPYRECGLRHQGKPYKVVPTALAGVPDVESEPGTDYLAVVADWSVSRHARTQGPMSHAEK